MWESNPPCPFVTGNIGFEVQEGHQSPIHSRNSWYNNKITYQRVLKEMVVEHYSFGSITIDGKTYTSDVIIYPGRVDSSWWRKEGHNLQVVDLAEVIEAEPQILIIGTGASGVMKVPQETISHIESKDIEVHVEKTDKAVELFNKLQKDKIVIAALHLTC